MGGFERFVKADVSSRANLDLRAFRCQVVLDSLLDVPQNMAVVLGDEVFDIIVHLENWERIEDGGGGDPPQPLQDGLEEGEIEDDGEADDNHRHGDEEQEAADEEMGEGQGEVDEADATRQTRPTPSKQASIEVDLARGGSGRSEEGAWRGRRWWPASSRGVDRGKCLPAEELDEVAGTRRERVRRGAGRSKDGGSRTRRGRRKPGRGVDRDAEGSKVRGGQPRNGPLDGGVLIESGGGVPIEGGGMRTTVSGGELHEGRRASILRLVEKNLGSSGYKKGIKFVKKYG